MTLLIQGQPVERIVIHGSEQTLWEPSTGSGNNGAMLRIAKPPEQLGMAESIQAGFDHIHSMEPYGSKAEMVDVIRFIFDHIHNIGSYGSKAGMTDTVEILINEEAV